MMDRLAQAAQDAEPWISPGGAAILSACGLILAGLIAGIVELRKTRVNAEAAQATASKVEHEVRPNTGGSMRDAVDGATRATHAIGNKLDKLTDLVNGMNNRLTRVEAHTEFLVPHARRQSDE